MKRFILFLILFTLSSFSHALSQEISVDADVDSSVITIGDPITYTFTVTYEPKLELIEPNIVSAIVDSAGCEILSDERLPIRTTEAGETVREWNYTITKWKVEETKIPAIPVKYLTPDSIAHEVLSNPIYIRVASVIAPGDTVKDIKGIKSQATIAKSYWYILWTILILLAIAGIIYGIYRWRKSREKAEPEPETYEPSSPPDEMAYAELDRIESLRLWEKDELKEHYDLISDCIRRYIEGRYNVDALELTTYELSRKLPKIVEEREHWLMIEELLTESDLVKFAKHKPEIGFAKRALDHARKIVKETTTQFKLFEEEEEERREVAE